MINDNSLGDRLNAVKYGQPIPNPQNKEQTVIMKKNEDNYQVSNKSSDYAFLIPKIINLIDVLFASFLYGYAFKTLFNVDWDILGILSVGFIFSHAISVFPRILFPKFFNK